MAGILDSLMQGYAEGVLGRNSGVAKENSAANTASAFQRLQEAISSDYSMQKKNFESDPSNKGKSWQMPSSTERFNDQIQAMILSGDPNLQSRGLELMTPDAMDKPTEFQKNYEYMKSANPSLSEMQYFQMLHPGPARTNVSVNLPKMDQPITLDDLQKLQMSNGQPVPIGTTMREAGAMGAKIGQTKEQSEKGSAAEVSADAIRTLGKNLNPTTTVKDTAIEYARGLPGILGQASSVAASAAGVPANPAAVRFNQSVTQAAAQTLKILSGASATDGEFDRIKSLYPQITDSPATKAIKYNTMLDQTQSIVDRAKSQGVTGLPDMSKIPRVNVPDEAKKTQQAQSAQQPQQRVTKSGVKYTVE